MPVSRSAEISIFIAKISDSFKIAPTSERPGRNPVQIFMKKRSAFTLIEILVVLAIIGVLAMVMIPAVGYARGALTKTKTKARFNEWVTAVKQYKMTYGFYPTLGQSVTSGSDTHFNLGEGSNSEAFVKSLSGRDPQTSNKLTGTERTKYNRKATAFCDFSEEDFTQEDGSVEYGKLTDGFHNPYIHLVMDTSKPEGRVQIPQKYLPEDATEDETNENGMLGTVLIFTSKVDGNDYESVYSWR